MATIRCQGRYFENVQAILFDKDGTLANVETYLTTLAQRRSHFITTHLLDPLPCPLPQIQSNLLSAFGLEANRLDPTGLMAVGSRYENEVAAAAYVAATGYGWVAALNLVQAAFQQAEASLPPKVTQTPPLAGTLPMIRQCAAAGLKIGIVSSDTQAEVKAFVESYAIAPINWYCGADATTLPKTHPDFLAFACQSMHIDRKATLVVGDSAADLQLAYHGAAGFLGITGGWNRAPKIEAAISSMMKLPINLPIDLPIVSFERLSQLEAFN
jgi:phosphoglycolate phosphatase